jgi:hypothetical protein
VAVIKPENLAVAFLLPGKTSLYVLYQYLSVNRSELIFLRSQTR